MAEQEQSKLLPCPFCGRSNPFSGTTLDDSCYVVCGDDDCSGMVGYSPTIPEAIAAWNTRTPTPNAVNADKALAVVPWPNGCNRTAPAALRFLARYDRPIGGEQTYNASHLEQIAGELEAMASKPLYTTPAPDKALMPDAAVGAHVDLLTKAVGDITAALLLAGQEDRVEAWTRPYVQAINLTDATPTPVEEPEKGATGNCSYCDGTGDVHRADGEWLGTCPCFTAATNAGQAEATSISVAEEWSVYMDDAVAKAPEPLRNLGEFLAGVLDEDHWKTAERYLNAAALKANGDAS